MPQQEAFKTAIEELTTNYTRLISNFSCDDFLKSSIDPFRFSFNVEVWGLRLAIKKEIEHKIEMKLEDLFGDFHENYLGNCTHLPTGTKWEILPQGQIPGADIANKKLQYYLQIKSKFNSMNSSSAKRLAKELDDLKQKKPNGVVGCGWVIAGPSRQAIGENDIRRVANIYKGKDLFVFVTGNKQEMDELISQFPILLKDMKEKFNFDELLERVTDKIIRELTSRASMMSTNIAGYLYLHSVK